MYLKHGMSGTPIYKVWADMVNRCINPKTKCYPRYGGRGIKVDPRWRASFEAFFSDVPPRPSPKHQLDRIENNGHYEPGNVRWVTGKENCRNARHNHLLEFDGKLRTLSEISEITGIHKATLRGRIRTGQPDPFNPGKLPRRSQRDHHQN